MAGKKKKVRSTKASRKTLDQIHYGEEPSGDYFEKKDLHAFFNWYSYSYDRARVNQVIVGFAKEHGYRNASKFKTLFIPGSIAAIIRGLDNGLNFPDHKNFHFLGKGNAGWQAYLHTEMRKYNKKAVELKPEDLDKDLIVKKKRKTVQENIDAKAGALLGEVDYQIDIWEGSKFDMYKYLTENKVSSVVASKMGQEYIPMKEELEEALAGNDPQLKEAYSYMNITEKRGFINFINKIILDSERYAENNKPIRKPRKAKAISATKQVSKLSFLDQDTDNQIKSIDPSKIVGSKQLWLYNSKTNEMIQYVQSDRGGLGVKGTTVQNFDSNLSSSKKLGVKTKHFIDRVLEGGSITLNKVMSEINSKASSVTGRVNNNMIILKVD